MTGSSRGVVDQVVTGDAFTFAGRPGVRDLVDVRCDAEGSSNDGVSVFRLRLPGQTDEGRDIRSAGSHEGFLTRCGRRIVDGL